MDNLTLMVKVKYTKKVNNMPMLDLLNQESTLEPMEPLVSTQLVSTKPVLTPQLAQLINQLIYTQLTMLKDTTD